MRSLKNIARITGIGYLLIFLSGFFANFYVLEGLVVTGNAAETSYNILTHLEQFRWGVFSFVIMVVVDVLLAWPLYLLLKNVNRNLALFSAWLRIVNGTIFAIALFNLFDVLHLFSGAPYIAELEPSFVQARVMFLLSTFNYTWLIGLVFFGLHLFVLGNLVMKSPHVPSILGLLLQIAALGYLADSFAQFLLSDYQYYQNLFEMIVVIPGVIGEFSLTLWLLIKGVRKIRPPRMPVSIQTV